MVLKRHQGNSQKEVAGDLVSYGEVMTITVGSMAGRHWSSSRDGRANHWGWLLKPPCTSHQLPMIHLLGVSPPTSSQTAPPTGDQVLKHTSLGGHSHTEDWSWQVTTDSCWVQHWIGRLMSLLSPQDDTAPSGL